MSNPHPIIKGEWLNIRPSPGYDTFNGREISEGSIPFGDFKGRVTFRRRKIDIICCGPSLALSYNGRTAYLNTDRLITEAVGMGLLDKSLDFTEAAE